MAEKFRSVIDDNLSKLCDLSSCSNRLLDKCRENGLISTSDREDIKKHGKGYDRNAAFYEIIRRKGAEAHIQVIGLMEETKEESNDVIRILRSGLSLDVTEIQALSEDKIRVLTQVKDCWFEVPEPMESFTGREKSLEDLHDLIIRNCGKECSVTVISQVTSITGLGGIGKTSLARKYAHTFSDEFNGNVIWINAETQIEETFDRLAGFLGIKIKDINGKKKPTEQITNEIYEYFSQRKSLFIFDNVVEYFYGVNKYLPKCLKKTSHRPYILMTSRNRELVEGAQELPLDVLSPRDAIEFLTKQIKLDDTDKDQNLITKVAEELQYLPLILQQAVAYINKLDRDRDDQSFGRKSNPIQTYLDLLQTKPDNIFGYDFCKKTGDDYSNTVLLTLDITMKLIKSLPFGEEAILILEVMAYFDPANIPLYIFQSTVPIISEPISLLKQYSMIEINKGVGNIHRFVQQIVRLQIATCENGEENVLRRALILFKTLGAGINSRHQLSIWKYAVQYDELVKDFIQVGVDVFENFYLDTHSIGILKHTLNALKKNLWPMGKENSGLITVKILLSGMVGLCKGSWSGEEKLNLILAWCKGLHQPLDLIIQDDVLMSRGKCIRANIATMTEELSWATFQESINNSRQLKTELADECLYLYKQIQYIPNKYKVFSIRHENESLDVEFGLIHSLVKLERFSEVLEFCQRVPPSCKECIWTSSRCLKRLADYLFKCISTEYPSKKQGKKQLEKSYKSIQEIYNAQKLLKSDNGGSGSTEYGQVPRYGDYYTLSSLKYSVVCLFALGRREEALIEASKLLKVVTNDKYTQFIYVYISYEVSIELMSHQCWELASEYLESFKYRATILPIGTDNKNFQVTRNPEKIRALGEFIDAFDKFRQFNELLHLPLLPDMRQMQLYVNKNFERQFEKDELERSCQFIKLVGSFNRTKKTK